MTTSSSPYSPRTKVSLPSGASSTEESRQLAIKPSRTGPLQTGLYRDSVWCCRSETVCASGWLSCVSVGRREREEVKRGKGGMGLPVSLQ